MPRFLGKRFAGAAAEERGRTRINHFCKRVKFFRFFDEFLETCLFVLIRVRTRRGIGKTRLAKASCWGRRCKKMFSELTFEDEHCSEYFCLITAIVTFANIATQHF